MSEFFRFPHTPHLTWLADGKPRDDKVLSKREAEMFLQYPVIIEEKIDGANLGISLSADGNQLQAQNRGQYLTPPFGGQLSRLTAWLGQHQAILKKHVTPDLILFGEWCAARHSLDYCALTDWFLLFDVYDRLHKKFWSVERRNTLVASLGIFCAPILSKGIFKLNDVIHQLTATESHYRNNTLEGLVIRQDQGDWNQSRTKLVNADFSQAIEEHWRSRTIVWNRVKHKNEATNL